MPTCPKCGQDRPDPSQPCAHCGASSEPRSAWTRYRSELGDRAALRELLPTRSHVTRALPHPAGWVLSIGAGVVLTLIVIHAVVLPAPAQAGQAETLRAAAAARDKAKARDEAEGRSRLRQCLQQVGRETSLACDALTGTAVTLRRTTCRAVRLTAGYARCSAARAGRAAHCIGHCLRQARACSHACAQPHASAPPTTPAPSTPPVPPAPPAPPTPPVPPAPPASPAPSGTSCLSPCWTSQITSCTRACLTTDPVPSPPDAL